MKPRKAVKARFKKTGTGKLMRSHPGRRHKLTKKASKRKRRLKKGVPVHVTQLKTYTHMMGVD